MFVKELYWKELGKLLFWWPGLAGIITLGLGVVEWGRNGMMGIVSACE
jgi:hypothetical protein